MTGIQQELGRAGSLARQSLDFALAWIGYAFARLRESVEGAGLPPVLAEALLVASLALVVAAALRLLRGGLRLLLVAALVALAARALGAF